MLGSDDVGKRHSRYLDFCRILDYEIHKSRVKMVTALDSTLAPFQWFPGSMCAKSLQSRLTLCDPMDCSPPGSLVRGIFHARTWRGLPCPLPGDLLHPGTEPASFSSFVLAGGFFIISTTWDALHGLHVDSTLSQAHESFRKEFPFWVPEKLRNSHVPHCELQTQMAWQLLLLVSWEP